MAIDYSEWDNIDTDSEPEDAPPAAPATTATSATSSPSGTIQAVIVRCDVDKRNYPGWSAMTIDEDHPVFSNPVALVPGLIGISLVFHRVGTRSAWQPDLDNQMVTYMNIDPESGLAPPEWKSHIGTVIAARKDKKALLPEHLEGVWMYCDRILDIFGENRTAPRHLYNRQAFEQWWEEYCDDAKQFRDTPPDDWRAVRSPYDT